MCFLPPAMASSPMPANAGGIILSFKRRDRRFNLTAPPGIPAASSFLLPADCMRYLTFGARWNHISIRWLWHADPLGSQSILFIDGQTRIARPESEVLAGRPGLRSHRMAV